MNNISLTHKGEAYTARHSALIPLGLPSGVDPASWREAINRRIDGHLADVDALLLALDAMTSDPDLETSDDGEPWLGWVGTGPTSCDSGDDREVDNSDWEDGGDCEPSLAAPDDKHCGSQISWARGSQTDLEATNEDGGDILDEPHDGGDDDEYSGGGVEPDGPTGHGLMSLDEKRAVDTEVRAMLALLRRRHERRDPDELTIIEDGIARVGAF